METQYQRKKCHKLDKIKEVSESTAEEVLLLKRVDGVRGKIMSTKLERITERMSKPRTVRRVKRGILGFRAEKLDHSVSKKDSN